MTVDDKFTNRVNKKIGQKSNLIGQSIILNILESIKSDLIPMSAEASEGILQGVGLGPFVFPGAVKDPPKKYNCTENSQEHTHLRLGGKHTHPSVDGIDE